MKIKGQDGACLVALREGAFSLAAVNRPEALRPGGWVRQVERQKLPCFSQVLGGLALNMIFWLSETEKAEAHIGDSQGSVGPQPQ